MRRSTKLALLITLPLFLNQVIPGRAEEGLASRIEKVIQHEQYREAHWGILVVDSATGEPVYALNADQMFRPASTTKLFTCAAALAVLGTDDRFETPVFQRGTVKDGKLQGDLILFASGDLTMGGRTRPDGTMAFRDHDHTYANGNDEAEVTDTDPLAGLNELARQIAASGIKRIEGNVLVDDRLFEHSRGSGSGPQMVTPIVINDNVVDVVIVPGKASAERATVHLRPETNFIRLDAQVNTIAGGKKPSIEMQTSDNAIIVRGEVPLRKKPLVRIHAVTNPTAFARSLFIEALQRAGVSVQTSALLPLDAELPEMESYNKLKQVAELKSPPFVEILKVTLKVSHNLYASTLPVFVALREEKRTVAEGLAAGKQWLEHLGVPLATISFGGGAGGANADHVTPRATVQLLRGLARRTDYEAFRACLPVLGEDGTLATAVPKDSPARGKAFAKTGTLMWHDLLNDRTLLTSKALAGTLTTAKGRSLTFAMFVNNVPLPKGTTTNREGRTLGKLCEILYEHAP